MQQPLDVELINVTKQFGTLKAVDNVSFGVPRGSFFSILGPSGSGKTTTLNIVSGFEEPDEGDVLINGERVNGVPPNLRRTNMVFQNLALFPLMTVRDNVAFGLKMRKTPKAEIEVRVDEMLAKVGLSGLGKRKPSQLSGGQQQRVAIARCLVVDPTVLLLDEPLGALDLKLREHMKIQLKHLQEEVGTTFIYITHDQSEALVMSDYVAIMNEGKLLQIGAPDEVYMNPTHSFVAGFVGESNRFTATVTRLEDGIAWLKDDSISIRMRPKNGVDVGETYNLYIRPEKVQILAAETDSALANAFQGSVKEVVFDGAVARCSVDVGHGVVIQSMLTRASDTPLPRKMENVTVGWRAQDVIGFLVE